MPALPLNEIQLADAARLKHAWNDYKRRTPGTSQEKVAAECGWKTQASFNQYLLGKIPLNLPALLKMCKAMGGINPSEISPTLAAQLPPATPTPAASDVVAPAVIEPVGPPAGHVRLQVLEAAPSAGPGSEPADYAAVLGHIDLAEQWARKRLGDRLDHIRALPVKGDSMSPTINDGDLAFVDTGCNHFEGEGVYVLVFNHALLIKRLSADFATQRIQILSDNERHKPALAREDELTICGRVRMWMAVKGY